jgi:hypothetical protein
MEKQHLNPGNHDGISEEPSPRQLHRPSLSNIIAKDRQRTEPQPVDSRTNGFGCRGYANSPATHGNEDVVASGRSSMISSRWSPPVITLHHHRMVLPSRWPFLPPYALDQALPFEIQLAP